MIADKAADLILQDRLKRVSRQQHKSESMQETASL